MKLFWWSNVISFVFLIISMLITIGFGIFFLVNAEISLAALIIVTIQSLLFLAFEFYFLVCLYSLYKKMKEESFPSQSPYPTYIMPNHQVEYRQNPYNPNFQMLVKQPGLQQPSYSSMVLQH